MKHAIRSLLIGLAIAVLPRDVHGQSESVEYYGTDAVGSIRITFDIAGNVIGRMDYGPFGQQLLPADAMPRERFAGNTTDGESDQGYFHARQLQARHGRFGQVDPIFEGLFNPQKLNRYAYALNNSVTFRDTTGLQVNCRQRADEDRVDCSILELVTASAVAANPVDGGGGGGGGGPRGAVERITSGQERRDERREEDHVQYHVCTGTARVLEGNPDTIGNTGAFPRVPVAAGTAAIIPGQFGGRNSPGIAPYIGGIAGNIDNGRASFTRVTDVIGGRSPIQGMNVRDALESLNPGTLIVELPSGEDMGTVPIVIRLPMELPCPTGTQEG